MSEGLNKVLLLGNIGADPELRVTPGGQAVLKIRIATNESYPDRNNVRQERTEWHRVTVWGKRAEALGKFLAKGSMILVEGRLQTSQYEKNGEKRYSTEIVATNIVLAGGKKGGAPAAEQPFVDESDVAPTGGAGKGADDLPFISSADTPIHTEQLCRWERW